METQLLLRNMTNIRKTNPVSAISCSKDGSQVEWNLSIWQSHPTGDVLNQWVQVLRFSDDATCGSLLLQRFLSFPFRCEAAAVPSERKPCVSLSPAYLTAPAFTSRFTYRTLTFRRE